ncbi:MAG: virulence RhuM family protein [Deltaproteobacteria bacterium]|nr:virulence RhuM family protein [Deltaproteobacteria bacterium]
MENKSEILIYQNANGNIRLDVHLDDETVWLTQTNMSHLFGKAVSTINEHIKNIYKEGELIESATMHKFGNSEFQKKAPNFYNLDVIISVGYRVKSQQGTQFRIWATQRLKEYLVKGFILNDERFKSGQSLNYFDELQQRIRDIRLSEKVFYQKIKDIYTTSIDYNPKDEKTHQFFKIVQNKLLWAISQQTAAELVYRRVDASLPLMGMLSFDNDQSHAPNKQQVRRLSDNRSRSEKSAGRGQFFAGLRANSSAICRKYAEK